MNNASNIATALMLMLIATSCAPDTSKYTVSYFKEHKEERKATLERCNNDPGRLRNDPLCVNAHEADFDEGFGSLRTLPPIGLLDDDDTHQGATKAGRTSTAGRK